MHVPKLNRVNDSTAVAMVRAAKFGHLVSMTDAGLESTGLPFTVDQRADQMILRGHLARANRHWKQLDGATVLVIFPLTDAYVSPSWYESKATDPKVVPTWNYELAHVHGTARVRNDSAWKLEMVSDLTDLHERDRRDEAPTWEVSDAPDDFVSKQLEAIVGVEIEIDRVEAKRKLSQNKSADDRNGVIEGMVGQDDHRALAVSEAMTSDRPVSPALQAALDQLDDMFARRRS